MKIWDGLVSIAFLVAAAWFAYQGDFERGTFCLAFTILCRVDMAIRKLNEREDGRDAPPDYRPRRSFMSRVRGE